MWRRDMGKKPSDIFKKQMPALSIPLVFFQAGEHLPFEVGLFALYNLSVCSHQESWRFSPRSINLFEDTDCEQNNFSLDTES